MNAKHVFISLVVIGSLAGCNAPPQPSDVTPEATAPLSGTIAIDGSSTVLPVSQLIVDAFTRENPGVHVSLGGSGSVVGFKKFCAGELDIADASRPIDQSELDACAAKGIELIELPLGFDALTVVVNARNSSVDCLTVGELKKLWEPEAQGKVASWNQVRAGLPAAPVPLFGPGTESGTFDYFTLAIVGASGRSRTDYTHSGDDNVLVRGVANDPNALGYFGYAYYAAHKDTLKAVSIDAGKGCVAPGADTVLNNTYQPLSRPLFIYVKKASAERPEVRALVRAYTDPATTQLVKKVGYLPLPLATTLRVGQRFEDGTTGSVFGGSGAVLGITAATFKDDDKIRNALVQ